jgi:hypothetical protein
MDRSGSTQKSVPRSISIATLLALTNHGTTGAITSAGAARTNFHDDNAVPYHEGLLSIQVKTVGGVGTTPTAVGATKTFTLKYAFSDDLIHLTDAPTVLAEQADSLVVALPNAISVAATGSVSFGSNVLEGARIRVGNRTYSFYASLDSAVDAVLIGATDGDTADNLVHAINGTGTPGTNYALTVTVNTQVTATQVAAVITFASRALDTDANAITLEVLADPAAIILPSGALLTGGVATGTRINLTDAFVFGGRYLYTWYDRSAFAANAKLDVTAKLIRL